LAILTGMATARAAASIMALGTDPRFDLRHAYWIVAGTAGVDPKMASVGTAAWARWVVDGDLAQEIDPRDAPPSWPTGIVPYERTAPYQLPAPPGHMDDGNIVYALNRGLVDWAYGLTKDTKLPDGPVLVAMRAPYDGPGKAAPFVMEGDALMSAKFWYGEHMNDWARAWTPYWTGGQGVFVMSAEEDTGIMQALTFLAQDGRVKLDRVLILRAASDYTLAPPGMSAADFMVKESNDNFPGTPAALDSLYRVAAPVAQALADDWAHTRDVTPGAR
jgi:purine nucleoside permease